jgi:hypothetical protein
MRFALQQTLPRSHANVDKALLSLGYCHFLPKSRRTLFNSHRYHYPRFLETSSFLRGPQYYGYKACLDPSPPLEPLNRQACFCCCSGRATSGIPSDKLASSVQDPLLDFVASSTLSLHRHSGGGRYLETLAGRLHWPWQTLPRWSCRTQHLRCAHHPRRPHYPRRDGDGKSLRYMSGQL